jgi:hypothetical protein
VNDDLGDLKARLRKVEESLATGGGPGIGGRVELAQAVSRARRLLRREDRSRPPSAAFRASVEQAEQAAKGSSS